MTKFNRQQILNHLAQVSHKSFTGFCIRHFVQTAHKKTDDEILQVVSELQGQMNDSQSPPAMKSTLGSKYDFIGSINTNQYSSSVRQ